MEVGEKAASTLINKLNHSQPASLSTIVLAANKDIGVLYGTFHLLRLLQTNLERWLYTLFSDVFQKTNS
jgi:hypothetical protein